MVKQVTETLYTGKYINFELTMYTTPAENGNTHFWEVTNRQDGSHIAYIEWFKRWKKFCLFPYPDTLFEEVCLKDISEFIVARTVEKKLLDKRIKDDR